MTPSERTTLLLGCQRALLGAVTANVRGLTVGMDGAVIHLRFLYEGELLDDDRDRFDVVATEIVADFNDRDIEVDCLRVDPPARIESYILEEWVYRRYENPPGPAMSVAR